MSERERRRHARARAVARRLSPIRSLSLSHLAEHARPVPVVVRHLRKGGQRISRNGDWIGRGRRGQGQCGGGAVLREERERETEFGELSATALASWRHSLRARPFYAALREF